MRMRRSWLFLVLLLVPNAARAHGHVAEFGGGLDYAYESHLIGFHLTGGVPSSKPANKDLTLIGDLGVRWGSRDQEDITHVTFMGGVRWTFDTPSLQRPLLSVHTLFGGTRSSNGRTDTDPSLAFGGGLELPFSVSPSSHGLSFRIQGDYVFRFSRGEDFPRLSVGLLYRWD